MEELEAFLILNHTPLANGRRIKQLLAYFGTARNILFSPPEKVSQALRDGGKILPALNSWQKNPSWKEDLLYVEKKGISLLSFSSEEYPPSLKELPDPPLLLYVKGELQNCDQRAVAIVGTRVCTLYGREMAQKFARESALNGFTVVSGLARGIDTAAHEGALEGGRTLAVIGSGFQHFYPKENEDLAEKIAKKGAVLSELPTSSLPQKRHFPRRNRIVSALSQGILLAEAPLKSGAMLTMELAHSQGKPSFALPGRADEESFRGNHFLIKKGRALLVENAQEMLSLLQPKELNLFFKTGAFSPTVDINEEERVLWDQLPSREVSIEEIAVRTTLPIGKISSLLMGLVLKQLVREFPGKIFKKVF